MFKRAASDLRELITLTEKIASFDATLAADRTIVPAESAREARRNWELRKIELMDRYELL